MILPRANDAESAVADSLRSTAWIRTRLGDAIAEAQTGFASGERLETGIIQLRMNNVTTRGTFDWSQYIRVPAAEDVVKTFTLRPGDVLFNNTNSTDLVGKSALFEGHQEAVVYSNHFTRLRTVPELLTPAYLAFWIQHQWNRRVFADICNRWIGQSAVQRDKLLSLELDLPPLDHQERTSHKLSLALKQFRVALQPAVDRFETANLVVHAIMRSAFNNPEAVGWPIQMLGEVSEIAGGMQKTPSRRPVIFHKPYLTVRNVKHGYLELDAVERFEVTEAEYDRLRLVRGDILIVEGNGSLDHIGRNALYEGEPPNCIHQNHIIRVRVSPSVLLPDFVSFYLNSPQGRAQMIQRAETSSGLYSLGAGKVASLEVPIPPLNEQHLLVNELLAMMGTTESMIQHLKEELASIQRLPSAILASVFEGRS